LKLFSRLHLGCHTTVQQRDIMHNDADDLSAAESERQDNESLGENNSNRSSSSGSVSDDDSRGESVSLLDRVARKRQSLLRKIRDLASSGRVEVMWLVDDGEYLALLMDSTLREELLNALDNHRISEFAFSVLDVDSTIDELIETKHATLNDVTALAKHFATCLSRMKYLESVSFYDCGAGMPSVSTFATIVRRCTQLRKVELWFADPDPSQIQSILIDNALSFGLQHRPFVRRVKLCNIDAPALRVLCTEVETLACLDSCTIMGVFHDKVRMTLAEAEPLAKLLQKSSLRYVRLCELDFENLESTAALCEGLRRSHITSLAATDLTFPSGTESAIVEAMLNPARQELEVQPWNGESQLFKALARQLGNHNSLKALRFPCLKSRDVPALTEFLQNVHDCQVQDVVLVFEKGNAALDAAIAHFIRRNKALRKLSIPEMNRPYSESFVSAIAAGTRSLQELSIYGSSSEHTDRLMERITPVLELNRLLNLYDPSFACLSRCKSDFVRRNLLLLALEAMELRFLFELLLRNEWDLQQLIRQYGREPLRGSRKRLFEQMAGED
jgi:hypothetical protein